MVGRVPHNTKRQVHCGEGETPSRHNTKHPNTHSRPLSAATAGYKYQPTTHHDQPSVCGGSRSCLLVELTADLQQPPYAPVRAHAYAPVRAHATLASKNHIRCATQLGGFDSFLARRPVAAATVESGQNLPPLTHASTAPTVNQMAKRWQPDRLQLGAERTTD